MTKKTFKFGDPYFQVGKDIREYIMDNLLISDKFDYNIKNFKILSNNIIYNIITSKKNHDNIIKSTIKLIEKNFKATAIKERYKINLRKKIREINLNNEIFNNFVDTSTQKPKKKMIINQDLDLDFY